MKKTLMYIIALTLLVINLFIYVTSYQREIDFPTICHYQIIHDRKSNDGKLSMKAVYTLLRTSKEQGEISVEGQISGDGFTYHMNRVMSFNLLREKESDIFLLNFYNMKRKVDDTTPDDLFSMQHPSMIAKMLLKVEKVKENAYLLTTQRTPLPICLK